MQQIRAEARQQTTVLRHSPTTPVMGQAAWNAHDQRWEWRWRWQWADGWAAHVADSYMDAAFPAAPRPRRTAVEQRRPDRDPWRAYGIASANVTEWGPARRRCPEKQRLFCSCHAIFVSEHKLVGEAVAAAEAQFQQWGFRAHIGPAVRTEKGGRSSGTAILLRRQYVQEAFHLDGAPLCTDRVTAIIWAWKRQRIFMCAVYLVSGVGLNDENVRVLSLALRAYVASALPGILAGDFNVTPEEMWAANLLQPLGLEIMAASTKQDRATISTEGGRQLDYFIVS